MPHTDQRNLAMQTFNNKPTPAFDLIELTAELEIPFKKHQPLKPLQTGNHLHNLALKKENVNQKLVFNGDETHGSVVLRQLSGKPLVISFYSPQWQQYGLNHLKHLNHLQREIKALGANVMVITPNVIDKTMEEIIWDNSLYLNFYYDHDNVIAKKFRVYADANPAWDRFPGIEVNVPLLATYVLDTTNQIIFDLVDDTLEKSIFADELISSLNNSYLYQLTSKSA